MEGLVERSAGLLEAKGADELMMTNEMYRLEDRIRSLDGHPIRCDQDAVLAPGMR